MEGIAAKPSQPVAIAPSWIRNFFPGYFALVMATGIVSMASHLQGFKAIAKALFWINVPAYTILWIITLVRLCRFPRDFVKDLTSHARGAGFLTQVAATCVLGKQFVLLTPFPHVGKWLWILAVVLWFVLIYTFFTAITLVEPKPTIEAAISGSWLLIVVSTESLCTLGTLVAGSFSRPEIILFVSLLAYVLGAMFYIILITLILYRWFFRSMEANMLTPPYWINMGALAITTLAGGRLLAAAMPGSILEPFRAYIAGFTILFWGTASWWIPLLLIVGFWKHGLQRLPVKYDPQYWSLVFPLGMYSVATFVFAEVNKLDFLAKISFVFAFAALAAWTVTAGGLIKNLLVREV